MERFAFSFPLFQGHKELFSDEVLSPYLEGLSILTDEERIQAVGALSLVASLLWRLAGLF